MVSPALLDPLDHVVALVKWDLLVLPAFPDLLVPLVLLVVDLTLASSPSPPRRRLLIQCAATGLTILVSCVTATVR